MKRAHIRHLSHKEATTALIALFVAFVGLEGCAAYHLYFTSRDVLSAGMIVAGWFRESLKLIVERIAEGI